MYVFTHMLPENLMALRGDRMSRRDRTIDLQLKDRIRLCGKTHYRIAKDADISPDIIDRFMSGERDIRLVTAAKIAEALGMELRPMSDNQGS